MALVRPLLEWRRAELAAIVAAAGITPVDDPANRDPRHDRSRFRGMLAEADWADAERLAASARWLADADEALDWALAPLLETRLRRAGQGLAIDAEGCAARNAATTAARRLRPHGRASGRAGRNWTALARR